MILQTKFYRIFSLIVKLPKQNAIFHDISPYVIFFFSALSPFVAYHEGKYKVHGIQINRLAELQKGGILVSRIPDTSGRNSGHFQIIAANLSIFGIKRFQHCWFLKQFNSKWGKLRRKQAFVQFYGSYYGKIQQIQDSDIF